MNMQIINDEDLLKGAKLNFHHCQIEGNRIAIFSSIGVFFSAVVERHITHPLTHLLMLSPFYSLVYKMLAM